MTVLIKISEIGDGIRETDELINIMMLSLTAYAPYLLTAYQNPEGIAFSEFYEFFGTMVNGTEQSIP